MRNETIRRMWAVVALGALLSAGTAVSAQALASGRGMIRAEVLPPEGDADGSFRANDAARRSAANDGMALTASVPALGLVDLDGSVYRISGIPGGASLYPAVAAAPLRSRAAGTLLAQGGSTWARATNGGRLVEVGFVNDLEMETSSTLDAGMPVGWIAISRSGGAMAVASGDGSRVILYRSCNARVAQEGIVEFGASSRHVRGIAVADDAESLIVLTDGEGWMEVRGWNESTRAVAVLAQGTELRAEMSADSARVGILDVAANRISLFDNRASGFTPTSIRDLPPIENDEQPELAGVYFVSGQFIATTVRGHGLRICGESGDCEWSRLPIPAVRRIRGLPGQSLLFLESARAGVPSYLLEFADGQTKWHFVGRVSEASRQLERGRGPRVGRPIR